MLKMLFSDYNITRRHRNSHCHCLKFLPTQVGFDAMCQTTTTLFKANNRCKISVTQCQITAAASMLNT